MYILQTPEKVNCSTLEKNVIVISNIVLDTVS